MPDGFLGTRANLLLDTVFVSNLIAPFWALYAAQLARRGEHRRHMRLQIILFAWLFVCVLSLEGSVRLGGGSGSLIAGSPYVGTALLRWIFVAHIGPAVATYLLWAWLVIASYRRRKDVLPGPFSARHRLAAKLVITGLFWTAASAIAVYIFGFAAA